MMLYYDYPHHGVLHGLVDDGVDGADKEVEGCQELLAAPCQIFLSLRIAEKFLLQLRRLVSQVGETITWTQ